MTPQEYAQALVDAVRRQLQPGEAVASHQAIVIVTQINDDLCVNTSINLDDVKLTQEHAEQTAFGILSAVRCNRAPVEVASFDVDKATAEALDAIDLKTGT